MTDSLIARLSADLRPVGSGWMLRRLALGVGAGALVSALFMTVALGPRPDLARAVGGAMFWVKFAYGLAIGGIALGVVERLARPGAGGASRVRWLALPALAVAVLAIAQLAAAPVEARRVMVMGHSAPVCPWLLLVCALPFLSGLIWAVRGMAPTRLKLAGAAVGLAAGGFGAVIYCLSCAELTAPFLAVWYTLGIAAATLIGWLLGPRLLRW